MSVQNKGSAKDASVEEAPPLRRSIGRYQLLRRLEGTDREVYEATDGKRDYLVALVQQDSVAREHVERDMDRCKQLEHRAVVPVIELLQDDGMRVLVFAHVAGVTLAQLAAHLHKRGELLSDLAIWHIGYECASALAAAHGLDGGPLVHGCLTPDQIIVTRQGSVRVIGLGLHSILAVEEGETAPAFRAPELREGKEPDVSSDVYALAAILWWLLAGELPPSDRPPERVSQKRSSVPIGITVSLQRALAPDSRKRFDSRRMAEALRRRAVGGDAELAWCMEMLRALSTDDAVPSSKAFPRSGVPPESVPPVRSAPLLASPPRASSPGSVSQVQLISRDADDDDTEDREPTDQRWISEPPSIETNDDCEPTGERFESRWNWDPDETGDDSLDQAGPLDEPIDQRIAAPGALLAPSEDGEPTGRRELSAPVPEPASIDDSEPTGRRDLAAGDDEPTLHYSRSKREITKVVPPDELRRQTAEDAADARRARLRRLARPLGATAGAVLVLGALALSMGSSGSSSVAAAFHPWVARAVASIATLRPEEPKQAPAATEERRDDSPQNALPEDYGYLMVDTDRRLDEAGVYVFGDYMGPVDQRIAVPCGKVHVRLGTRPPRGAPGRRWLSSSKTVQVLCGAVTIVSLQADAEPARVAPRRIAAKPERPRITAPPPDRTWLPDDL